MFDFVVWRLKRSFEDGWSVSPWRQSLLFALVAFTALSPSLASADDLTISTNETTAVSTAQGDGTGPGNIIIENNGAIDLTSGTPVTVNSDHDLDNFGTLRTETEEDGIGVFVDLNAEPDIDASITNAGVITLLGPAEGSPIENQPVENFGILVTGTGTQTGSIINAQGASIEVGGNASAAILVDGTMFGSVFNDGTLNTVGVESTSLGIYDDVDGLILNTGTIAASGRDGVGIYMGGSLTGTITNSGSINIGAGAARTFDGTFIPEVRGDAGIWIAGSVNGGMQILGNQVPEFVEQTLSFDDPAFSIPDAEINVVGRGQAIKIRPGGLSGRLNNITVGAVGSGDNAFAVLNQGLITTGSTQEGVNVEAVVIEGLVASGTVYNVTLAGGIRNDGGDIRTGTIDGTATAIRIGNHAAVPEILNSGDITALTNDSTGDVNNNIVGDMGGDAFAIIVEESGTLTSIDNTGVIRADAMGSGSSAGAIIVQSGSLTSFSNTGDVFALIQDGSTGISTALDVRTSTSDIEFSNSGTIIGDIFLGDGSDTFTSTGGSITGEITMAGGDDVVTLADTTVLGSFLFTTGNKTASITNTTLNGGFVETGAIIDLTLRDSDWTITAGEAASLRTLDVQGTSTLRVEVDGVNNRAGTIAATDTASISDTTTIVPVLRSVITDQQTFTLVQAGQLNTNITFDTAQTAETSYMHTTAVVRDPGDPNRILLQVSRRSAEELGLEQNIGTFYESSSAALSQDSELFTDLASITAQPEFESALDQFLPDTSDAVFQSAIDQQNMAFGAINRRLDRVPAQGFYRDRPTVWLQTMGHYAKRKADELRPGYSTWSGGIAVGFDRQFDRLTRAGLAYTQLWSFPDELNSLDKPTEFSSSQLNGYFRMGSAHRHLQGAVTLGYDSFNSERRVVFGSLDRSVLGKWDGYEFGSALQLALGVKRDSWSLVPTARLSYLLLHQGSHTETDGGDGLNLSFSSDNTDSLRGGLGFAARREFILEDDSILQFEGRTTYTREFMSGTRNMEVAFAADGTPFNLLASPLTQDVFSVGLGMFYKNDHATISFDYDGEKASGYTAHTGTVTVRFRF